MLSSIGIKDYQSIASEAGLGTRVNKKSVQKFCETLYPLTNIGKVSVMQGEYILI